MVRLAATVCLVLFALPGVEPAAFDHDHRAVVARVMPAYVMIGGGSGVVIGADGEMLTNHHVIAEQVGRGEKRFLVRVADRFRHARLLGTDPYGDVALLRIEDAEDLDYVEFATALRVGQQTFAIGNPFGAMGTGGDPTVTFGIVSSLHRFRGRYGDAIQTDAPINPGNSGGPLLTLAGRLAGINGQIRTRTGARANTGIGLAIPAEQILRFLPALRRAGGREVYHGHLPGMVGDPRERDGVQNGAELAEVRDSSPAWEAGLRSGDRVVAVDEHPVLNFNRLQGLLLTRPEGHAVVLKVIRDGRTLDLDAELAPFRPGHLGFDVERPQNPKEWALLMRKLRTDPGALPPRVVAFEPHQPARESGLEKDDVIVAVDGNEVGNIVEFFRYLEGRRRNDRFRAGDVVELRVQRWNRETKVMDEHRIEVEVGSKFAVP